MTRKWTKSKQMTFSKILVMILLIVSIIDMQIPFVLAFLGRIEIAETLAVAIVTEILGVFATYSAKAFLENREEAKIKLEREKEGIDSEG